MRTVNLYEAKTQLSKLVQEAVMGEDVVIAKNGRPLVKLVPIHPYKRSDHFGFGADMIVSFDEATFDELPDGFEEYA